MSNGAPQHIRLDGIVDYTAAPDTLCILAQHDPEKVRELKSRFMEMWAASRPAVSATTLGL